MPPLDNGMAEPYLYLGAQQFLNERQSMRKKKEKSPLPIKKDSSKNLIWSDYQKAIFDNIANGTGHTIIEARAGGSKTSSLIEGLKYVPKNCKTIVLAFNKIIQQELRERAPSYIQDVLTFHSLGFRAIRQRFGSVELNDHKVFEIAKDLLPNENYDLLTNLVETVQFCKCGLVDIPNQIDKLIDQFTIDTCELDRETFIKYVLQILSKDKLKTEMIDFADMCWFPYVYNLSLGLYDFVFVDECFPYDQYISTDCGKEKIGILCQKFKNDEKMPLLSSYNEIENKFEYCRITNVWNRGKRKLVEIRCGEQSIFCTDNHKFLTNNGWLQAGEMSSGILIKTTSSVEYAIVTEIKQTNRYEDVFDIEVEKNHNFIAYLAQNSQLHDGLIAHNCQDLNKSQLIMARKLCKPGSRIVACEDEFQQIYGWRMADNSVLEQIKKEPTTNILKLPISYRCPKKVIELAQNWVPDITCPKTAEEGEVNEISLNQIYEKASPGCFVLSRTNAPLISICLGFIKRNIRANIRGRDVGKQLGYLIKKSKKKLIPQFVKWLEDWKNREVLKLKEKNLSTENILDRYECLTCLCDECSTLSEVVKKVEDLFNDTDENNVVICSTVHRAKGLERNDVFILRYSFFSGWIDTAHLVEKPNENMNIAYVATTRAKKRLFIVNKQYKEKQK